MFGTEARERGGRRVPHCAGVDDEVAVTVLAGVAMHRMRGGFPRLPHARQQVSTTEAGVRRFGWKCASRHCAMPVVEERKHRTILVMHDRLIGGDTEPTIQFLEDSLIVILALFVLVEEIGQCFHPL